MKNQILFSWDSTGSMFPALSQVRRYVEDTVKELFAAIPNLEISCISHGDYCDGPNWLSKLPLTSNQNAVCNFIKTAPATGGGDSPEAYESVIHSAHEDFEWQPDANKAFVLIGDDIPHPKGYRCGGLTYNYDWKEEAKYLSRENVKIYSIQCLGNSYATSFYEGLAAEGNGYKLDLNQFNTITDLLKAICYQQSGQLPQFETQLSKRGTIIDISLLQNLDVLSGRKKREAKKSVYAKDAVHPARFQILSVDKDVPIMNFVKDNGLTFKTGRGFYEFTKSVKVQDYKEVIIQDKNTGEMFSGDKARLILGIPVGKTAQVKPSMMDQYVGFIQSTSQNRKLLAGTHFLYEVSKD